MDTQIDPVSRLAAAGIKLPVSPEPLANYVPATRNGRLVYTSGQLPLRAGQLLHRGKLGREVTLKHGRECSRQATVNALAAIAAVAGGLGRVASVVKVTVYVASDPSFTAQPGVADGASDLLDLAFGPRGQRARIAVGVAVLPLDAPVEVELVVELKSAVRRPSHTGAASPHLRRKIGQSKTKPKTMGGSRRRAQRNGQTGPGTEIHAQAGPSVTLRTMPPDVKRKVAEVLAERAKGGENRQALLDEILTIVLDPGIGDEQMGSMLRTSIGMERMRAA